ncbi:MAG: hypothetical protein ACI9JN_002821, partial [Bacteroidia bacterium]
MIIVCKTDNFILQLSCCFPVRFWRRLARLELEAITSIDFMCPIR